MYRYRSSFILWLLGGFLSAGPASAALITLGNDHASGGASQDGWNSILLVDQTDLYTNTSGAPETIDLRDFNFWVGVNRGRVTPFIVQLHGVDTFTVLVVGDTRVSGVDYLSAGSHSFPFSQSPIAIQIDDGVTIATGFTNANPDGSGVAGSVIPFNGGGHSLWLTGGGGNNDAGSITAGQAPQAGSSTLALNRNYTYNITFDTGPSAPQPPTDILLSNHELFPGIPANTVFSTLSSADTDSSSHTFTLVSGAGDEDNEWFEISGNELSLNVVTGGAGTPYRIRIRATDPDALFFEKAFVLDVVAGQPPAALMLDNATVVIDAPAATTVGTLSSDDPNTGDRHTYTLIAGTGDTDNTVFQISGDQLRTAQAMPGQAAQYSIRVRTSDLSGLFLEQVFAITVREPSIRINEFVADNRSTIQDRDGEYSDWIEIYNEQTHSTNLAGWYLTDDPADLTKWQFPSRVINGEDFLVVFASGKDRSDALIRELHTNFKLDRNGEYLALVKPDGLTIINEFVPTFPVQEDDISYGVGSSGEPTGYMFPATPDQPNGEAFATAVNRPQFDVGRGFHDAAFLLTLTPAIPGSTIRYTTNGSTPTTSSGTVYAGPILISQTTTLRAISYDASTVSSPVITHSYIFVDDVKNQGVMSPSITQDPTWGPLMRDSLLALPAISLVSGDSISQTESETSIELIFPDGTSGFQHNAGVEHFGGHSLGYAKKSMRISFKEIYGLTKLNYDLFGGSAAREFDQLILRSGSHDTAFYTNSTRGSFVRNRWLNDLHRSLGHPSPRGRYVHVYINGTYWGQHHLMERPNAAFMASYFGGSKSDYDALNSGSAIDGDTAAYSAMLNNTGNYPALKEHLDVENYADYMLLQFYCGNNWDWNHAQNWMGARKREAGAGYRFFHWDSDMIIRRGVNADVINRGGPGNMWGGVSAHPEFVDMLADRAQNYFFNDGILTEERAWNSVQAIADEIQLSLIAETARWPISGYDMHVWQTVLDQMKEMMKAGTDNQSRTTVVIQQLRNYGFFPAFDAPVFSPNGGAVPNNFSLALSLPGNAAGGAIYYTLDGSDPKNGMLYSGNLALTQSGYVKARIKLGADWSALQEAFFAVDTSAPRVGDLVVTEINFNPDGSDVYEYLELKNVSGGNLLLDGLAFTNGIVFAFPDHLVLAPDEHVLVIGDEASFNSRYVDAASPYAYSGIRVAGVYLGSLNDGGEQLALAADGTNPLFCIDYSGTGAWPGRADGKGSAAELIDPSLAPTTLPALNAFLNDGSHWRPTSEFHGSPGRDGLGPDNRVVINELLAHSDAPAVDAIELLNTTTGTLPIAGWFLSDSSDDYRKFRIPAGASIGDGGFMVYDESSFNNPGNPDSFVSFALSSSLGEDVYLLEADVQTNLIRFVDHVDFGATATGESAGRWPDGTGPLYPMRQQTFGLPNASGGNGVRVGPVVVSEIHYNPTQAPDNHLEYVQLRNAGAAIESLDNWRLRGDVDLDFPPGLVLAPAETVLLVGFDPADAPLADVFRTAYHVRADARLLGPWTNQGTTPALLDNGGARVRLYRPDNLEIPTNGGPPFHPMLTEDQVEYDDDAPWPLAANGTGASLQRVEYLGIGDNPANWRASATPLNGYANWAAATFPPGTSAADMLLTADPDNDRLINFLEYAHVLNPLVADAGGALATRLDSSSGDLLFDFRRHRAAVELIYTISVSPNLQTWDRTHSDIEIMYVTPAGDGKTDLVRARYLKNPSDPATPDTVYFSLDVDAP